MRCRLISWKLTWLIQWQQLQLRRNDTLNMKFLWEWVLANTIFNFWAHFLAPRLWLWRAIAETLEFFHCMLDSSLGSCDLYFIHEIFPEFFWILVILIGISLYFFDISLIARYFWTKLIEYQRLEHLNSCFENFLRNWTGFYSLSLKFQQISCHIIDFWGLPRISLNTRRKAPDFVMLSMFW